METDWVMLCVPRTASTSLSVMLGMRSMDGEPRVTDNHYFGHMPAWMLQQQFGDKWDRIFSFGFVRNPWDRLVSICARINPEQLGNRHKFKNWLYNDCPDREGKQHYVCKAMRIQDPQIDFLLPCRFIGRFESFEQDVARICHIIGREVPEAVHEEKKEHLPYREMYTEETKEWVWRHYAEDILTFGYKF